MSSPEAPSLAAVLAEAVTANPGWSQPDEALTAYRYTSTTEQGGPAGPWATVHRRLGWWVHTVWADAEGTRLLEEARFGYGSPGEAIVQANFVLNNYVHYWSAEA